MSPEEPVSRVEAIRRFNRFYTRQLGLLQEHLLDSPFTLSEARVIYELAQHQEATARQLVGELQLDAGYLSRILRRLHQRRLLGRRPSPTDGREKRISLTQRGQQSFAQLNAASQREIEAVLGRL